MSNNKKVKSATIEAQETGFVVCLGPLDVKVLNTWYAFSTLEDALSFIEVSLEGEDSL